MKPIRCLIIDDERLARVELRALLQEAGGCTVVGEAANALSGQQLIVELKPDVLFLDINMPQVNGFELLGILNYCPPVVFVTAYDEFAIRAFEVNALDYLLKPVDPSRLAKTLERVRLTTSAGQERLFIPNNRGGRFVDVEEIYLLRAYDHYVRLYHAQGDDLLYRSLTDMEALLNPAAYFRANRSEIVKIDAVKAATKLSRGRYLFSLPAEQEVTVSERRSVAWRRLNS